MKTIFSFFALFCSVAIVAQPQKSPKVFDRINAEMAAFKVDTTAPPDDQLSEKIVALRKLRGGFNINEALEYKIAELRTQKNTEGLDRMEAFFKTGKGSKWLENAVIWIYRKQFTLTEIDELIRFYQTPAGQKMAEQFPVIMLQSLKASEQITAWAQRK